MSMCENAKWHLWDAMIGLQEKVINTCLWMEFKLLWITNDHEIFLGEPYVTNTNQISVKEYQLSTNTSTEWEIYTTSSNPNK